MAQLDNGHGQEVWRAAPRFEGLYEVSSLGRVRRRGRYKVLTGHYGGAGGIYLFVLLQHKDLKVRWRLHCLVATVFIGPRPSEKHQIRHLDGNPKNCAALNLAWGTAKENAADRERHGRTARGERHGFSKLRTADIIAIRRSGESSHTLAKRFSVKPSTINDARSGRRWRHVEAA